MLERQEPGLLNPITATGTLNPTGLAVRGATGSSRQFQPTVEWFFADKGAGAVDLNNTVGATPTFTRATTAWTKLSSGLWASVASGVARHFYSGFNTAVGNPLGYLAEGSRINRCLQARDFTSVSWVKTNITSGQDAIGIDGVANSASRLSAIGPNGTCLQAITSTSATRTFSAYVRRLTGVGNVFITLDNDATRTDITASINSSTWTLVQATQTLANPTVGFKIATIGDEIEVDMAQEELNSASSPIPTTTVAVTRSADVLTYPTTDWLNATAGTLLAEYQNQALHGSGAFPPVSLNDTTSNERMLIYTDDVDDAVKWAVIDGGVIGVNFGTIVPGLNTNIRAAACYTLNEFALSVNGNTAGTDTSGTVPTVTQLQIGGDPNTVELTGTIRRVAYYNRRLSNAALQVLTA